MRQLVSAVLVACLPMAAIAQDAVIRIEAKRGEAAASQAATGWRQKFDDVVTFPLNGEWIGIALGPLPREKADALLAELRGSGRIPADSFVTARGDDITLTPVAEADGAALTGTLAPDIAENRSAGQDDALKAGADGNPEVAPVGAHEQAATVATPVDVPDPVVEPVVAGPDTYIRLQSLRTEAEAGEALTRWRKDFPGAGMWRLPGDWFGVALGPLKEETAQAWLGIFRQGGILPDDAFTSHADEMGEIVTPGEAPDLPAPDGTRQMPPVHEVQQALRWAGLYEGDIDGKPGPQTNAAIQAEMLAERLSPDPGTAMQKLIERREAWRKEMGLTLLKDEHTGLSLMAPLDKLQFDRTERALSIYGPANGSGGALILFSQPGGQQELLDLSGLITALGWVPQPERQIEPGHVLLKGQNSDHFGHAEGWVRDGRAEGFVLVWPASDVKIHERLATEMSDSLTRIETEATEDQDSPTGPEITPVQP